jgi:hypothetical protein
MKILADADTPRLLVERLVTSGHDVFWAVTTQRFFSVVENDRIRRTPLP